MTITRDSNSTDKGIKQECDVTGDRTRDLTEGRAPTNCIPPPPHRLLRGHMLLTMKLFPAKISEWAAFENQ